MNYTFITKLKDLRFFAFLFIQNLANYCVLTVPLYIKTILIKLGKAISGDESNNKRGKVLQK